MWRRTLLAAGLAMAMAVAAQAQRPALTGYVVIRVNLATTPGGAATGDAMTQPGYAPPGGGQSGYEPPGGQRGYGPPGGQPGYGPPGGQPGYAPPGGQATGQQGPADLNQSVAAVVYYRNILTSRVYPKNSPSQQNPDGMIRVVTEYGAPFVFTDKKTIEIYPVPANYNPQQYVKNRYTAWAKAKDPQAGMQLVADALQVGMVDEAMKYAEETAASVEARKDQAQPAPVTKFVAAFRTVAPKLATPGVDTGEAEKWREKLQAAAVEHGGHYALVTWGDQSVGRDAVKRRLDKLEANFKAFFLWHAHAGVPLDVPERKLVAVLADGANALTQLRYALDGLPVVADAFFSPVNQVLVLSPQRTDDVGRNFSRFVQTKYRAGWNREELLKGVGPLLERGETVLPVVEAMTLSLVDKAVEDAAADAMITREGTRQLYSACGLLPKHVNLPEWVNHGVANLHYKPKGPIYANEASKTPTMVVGINAGHGAANYVLHRAFKQMQVKGELNPNPAELLMNTLTDAYFDASRDGKDIDPKPKPAAKDVGVAVTGSGAGAGGPPGYGPGGYPMGPGGSGYPMPGYGPPGSGEGGAGGYPTPGAGGPTAPDPAKEKRELQTRLDSKAQATAWALTFYASKRKTPAMMTFYGDLGRMPRDMRLDRQAVVRAFCAAFGLADAKSPDGYDKAAFAQFAKEWVEFIRAYPPSGYELRMEQPADPARNLNQGVPGSYPMDPSGGMSGESGVSP